MATGYRVERKGTNEIYGGDGMSADSPMFTLDLASRVLLQLAAKNVESVTAYRLLLRLEVSHVTNETAIDGIGKITGSVPRE